MHKWWAQRLGTIFHGILTGCLIFPNDDFKNAFYVPGEHSDVTILDPFMGSGTTIGEAHRLGCTTFGMDINPIACESVRVAMSQLRKEDLLASFNHLSEIVGEKIKATYRTEDEIKNGSEVLYYFWVKQVPCPSCQLDTDLFSTYVFAKNMHPNKHIVQILCPRCENIFPGKSQDRTTKCTACSHVFDPYSGSVKGTQARCMHCSKEFAVIDSIRNAGKKPNHRLYAKLILAPDGTKEYHAATNKDHKKYAYCSRILKKAIREKSIKLPTAKLADGHNTRQAINYNYNKWREFFNDRQLLVLGWLHGAILTIDDRASRDALLLLFSGILEFNNMFVSYKGEGTGAVRHMFSHHILKPERMPLEANVWGTEKSSGSFLNLFKSRLLRAVSYRDAPFEITTDGKTKTVPCGRPIRGDVIMHFPQNTKHKMGETYLSCGSSEMTGLAENSIDYVITDPPFFDNVYYSELADFFYSWQVLHPHGFIRQGHTTRNLKEVQDSSSEKFSKKLKSVFVECGRVLKNDGLLVFTYHHSRPEGWSSVAKAIHDSGFVLINSHPVKSEMSVAVPKSQSKSPIQLDVIFVCKKNNGSYISNITPKSVLNAVVGKVGYKANLLRAAGLVLSDNDIKMITYSQFLVALGRSKIFSTPKLLDKYLQELESVMIRAPI